MSEQEKKWEEEAKEAYRKEGINLIGSLKEYTMGYFQACQKREEECPFCHETDFDLIGLKMHIQRGWCKVWEEIK